MISRAGAHSPSDNLVTMVMLDGARPDVFDRLVAAGDLPTISRHVLEPGGRVPATTSPTSRFSPAAIPERVRCRERDGWM